MDGHRTPRHETATCGRFVMGRAPRAPRGGFNLQKKKMMKDETYFELSVTVQFARPVGTPAPPVSFLCFSSVLSLTVTYLYSSLCLFFAMKHPTLTDEEATADVGIPIW